MPHEVRFVRRPLRFAFIKTRMKLTVFNRAADHTKHRLWIRVRESFKENVLRAGCADAGQPPEFHPQVSVCVETAKGRSLAASQTAFSSWLKILMC